VARLFGIAEEGEVCYLVMEWAQLGAIDQFLAENRQLNPPLSLLP
jgi:hypothetical protein